MDPRSVAATAPRFHVFATTEAVVDAAVDRIAGAAAEAIAKRGAFHVVLTGGNTPRAVYARLVDCPTDWSRWHVYFGDERCLPPDDPDRNSRMAHDTWLDHVPIPNGRVHAIPAELGPETGARAYAPVVAPVTFDLVLLGLGEDGHTASLFPGRDWGIGSDAPAVLAVHDAPKPPPDRVSLSARKLSESREVLFLVTGDTKRSALSRWEAGDAIPASAIPAPTVWLDAAAAPAAR